MIDLYLLRHGQAVAYGTPGVEDDARPLTEDGEARMRKIARGLRRLDLGVEAIVTSPLPRARRTAEIVAEELGLGERLETSSELRSGASPRTIRDWLGGRTEERLMIVGHNPEFTELVGVLIGLAVAPVPFELKKGAVAALEAAEAGGFRLAWLAPPRLLRRLGD